MSEYQPESSGERPIQPPQGQGFPPPPHYPGYQSGSVPQQPGPVPQQPYPGGQPQGPYPTGPYPAQPHPTQPFPTEPFQQYPGQQPQQYPQYQEPQQHRYQAQPPQPQYQPQPEYPQYQTEYLAAGPGYPPPPAPPRRRRRGLWVGVGALTVVALGAGSVAAYTYLSGSGTTLDKQVPADSVAYAEVNLDPPAGQKVAALRFLKHFPSVKVNENANTLLDALLEQIISDPADRQKFVQNVQPWLGKHAAVAADPQGDRVRPVVVAEVKDAGAARTGLTNLGKDQDFGFVVGDGNVVIAETQEIANLAAADAAKAALSGNGTYSDDVKAVGGDKGIVTGWANFAEAAKYIPQANRNGANLDSLQGTRIAMTLSFTDTVADLTVKTFGGNQPQAAPGIGARVATLPDDTAVAVGISGGDKLVRQAYDALKNAGLADELANELDQYDLDLPEDIANLVGSQTVIAATGDADDPDFGVLTKSADPARATEVAKRLLAEVDESAELAQQQTADGLALASSQDYLSKLTGQGGLGATDGYRAAVPDAGSAQYVIYVDVRRAIQLSGESGSLPDEVGSVRAVGLTASSQGGSSTLHLRVVVG
jgi:hypothetical protein